MKLTLIFMTKDTYINLSIYHLTKFSSSSSRNTEFKEILPSSHNGGKTTTEKVLGSE